MKILHWLKRYFYVVGVLFNISIVITLIVGVVIGAMIYKDYNLPPNVFFEKAAQSFAKSQSPLLNRLAAPTQSIASLFEQKSTTLQLKVSNFEDYIGANEVHSIGRSFNDNTDPRLAHHYRQLSQKRYLREINVNNIKELIQAINAAKAGDDIVVAPGEYELSASRVYFKNSGSSINPIRLRASQFGQVTIQSKAYEGFVIQGDYWVIQNLKVNGSCQRHVDCEHAIHLVGSRHVTIVNNQFTNFNSIIKANGAGDAINRRYPDHVLIERNSLYNTVARNTHTAVTLIDVVAGNDWIIRRNFIAGNSKNGSDRTSYAAFLKGNSARGLFEQNIIDCDKGLPMDGSTRIGLSFGGGGTGEAYCREGHCQQEHAEGIMRNNLILNCASDVGVYLNQSSNTILSHNTLLNNLGIDVRFKASSLQSTANLLTGRLRERDGGKLTSNNDSVIDEWQAIGEQSVKSATRYDLCGIERGKFSRAGAISPQCSISICQIQEKN